MREGGNTPSLFIFDRPRTTHAAGIQRFKALQYFFVRTGARQIAQKNPENIFTFVHFANRQIACKVV